jgi:hypothetical protein
MPSAGVRNGLVLALGIAFTRWRVLHENEVLGDGHACFLLFGLISN